MSRISAVVCTLFVILLGSAPSSRSLHAQEPARSILRGRVVSPDDAVAVPDANITVTRVGPTSDAPASTPLQVRADADGYFAASLAPGTYRVLAEAFGFEAGELSGVVVREGVSTDITVRLRIAPFRLEEIVVAPSTYGMLREHVVSGQLLTREELEVRPHWGNDLLRSVAQAPGITTNDFTAMPFVRGARPQEVLTVLDGLELYEPYHLKQWDGSLSVVDVDAVADVDLSTGGFPVEYGDASTGVLSMRTATPPPGPTRTTLGLDFLSSVLKSEGSFSEGNGAWTVSARRGFLRLIFELTGRNDEEDLRPSYYDALAKVRYQVAPGHLVSAHLLRAGDDNRGVENDSTVYRHRYGSTYAWVSWDADVTPTVSAKTVASVGRVTRNRTGSDFPQPGAVPDVEVRDESGFDFFGLRQDWLIHLSNRALLKAGFEGRWGSADYDYHRWRRYWLPNVTDPNRPDFVRQLDTLSIFATRTGIETGAYLAGRVQAADPLTVEVGLRYDRQHHTGEEDWGESQISPRVNAAMKLGPRTTLRGGWGHYHQSQGLHELWVADGDMTFYPAQRAEHRVLGIEHTTRSGVQLRAEAYQRHLTDPLPEYRNLENDIEALREEGPEDRVFVRPDRGRAQGVELFAKGGGGGPLAWAASYALSEAEERVDGRWVPLPHDQRHALNVQIAVRPQSTWAISLGWVYHSAWPFTERSYSLAHTVNGYAYLVQRHGPLNGSRLIDYSRVDFRVSKEFRTRRGNVMVYLDVFNLLNRENAQAASYAVGVYEGQLFVERGIHPQLEVMPSLGLRWVF